MLLKNPITEDKTIWAGLNHPELPLEEADIAAENHPHHLAHHRGFPGYLPCEGQGSG